MMELGAVVCLPRQPKCLTCPVHALCATRGEHPRREKPKQRKREIYFALNLRDDSVLLVQRPPDASLMAGMWELPELTNPIGVKPQFTLRHSITVTDYTVKVIAAEAPKGNGGQWVRKSRLTKLPLTGLARKILRVVLKRDQVRPRRSAFPEIRCFLHARILTAVDTQKNIRVLR
jgi:A/G-specific adenine glycosylase